MGAAEQDQSMEEILQSIKRIIADEGEEEGDVSAEASAPTEEQEEVSEIEVSEVEDATEGAIEEVPVAAEEAPAPEGDVLELTDIVREDGTVSTVKDPAPEKEVQEEAMEAPAEAAPLPQPEEVEDFVMADDGDGLLSEDAAKASSGALEELLKEDNAAPEPAPKPTTPSPAFRAGNTVEDLVMEALRPMLKEWLDGNLPQITEQLVKEEIKRISPK